MNRRKLSDRVGDVIMAFLHLCLLSVWIFTIVLEKDISRYQLGGILCVALMWVSYKCGTDIRYAVRVRRLIRKILGYV